METEQIAQCGKVLDYPVSPQTAIQIVHELFVKKDVPRCFIPGTSRCSYPANNDSQIGCAIGCLLPLDIARRLEEQSGGMSVFAWSRNPEIYNGDLEITKYLQVDEDNLDFWKMLQLWHDNHNSNESELLELANKWNLEIT